MKKLRILVHVPVDVDGTSWYRGYGPIAQLAREYPEIEIMVFNDWRWCNMAHADILFLQRPFNEVHLPFAEYAHKMGLPIWLDFDDNLINVPIDNTTFPVYGNPATIERVKKIISLATYMTVATLPLKNLYADLCKNIHIVPNTLSDLAMRCAPAHKRHEKREKKIMWRGGGTHEKDLMSHHNEILELAKEFQDWTWEFLGYNPWWLVESLGKNGLYTGYQDLIDYHKHMYESKASIFIIPLHDSTFNRCKSSIGWLEASYAGAASVVPRQIPDFNDKPAFEYDAPIFGEAPSANFYGVLREAITNEEKREETAIAAHKFALENFTTKKANLRRMELLRQYALCLS